MKQLLYGVILFLLGAAACFLLVRAFGPPAGDHPPSHAKATVTRRDISSSVLATGIIKPMVGAEVQVGSRISGVVRRLHTNIGDVVSQGELLAELDGVELRAKLDQARAAHEMARAELEFAELDLARKRSLAEQSMIAADELELAEKAHRIAELSVAEAAANVGYAETQLTYTQIRAPITGVVASVTTQEGETVAASFSTPTFVTIIDLGRLELWAYVDETDIGRIAEGQEARFTVDTYPETTFAGEVVSIYPNAVIQNTVVNYVTTVRIGDRQGRVLRPEMTTNVTILLETRDNVLTVPRAAITRELGEYRVYVLEGNQSRPRAVQVGWRDDAFTEILSGLEEGETILIEGP